MKITTLERLKSNFPYEPYELQSSIIYSESKYEESKVKVSSNMTQDMNKIKCYLDGIYQDMPKTKTNLSIHNKLTSNLDKLIFATDGSYLLNPLVYDENNESFRFQFSYYDYDNTEKYGIDWRNSTVEEFIDYMLENCGGLIFRVFYLDVPWYNTLQFENNSLTGKVIKTWCKNSKSEESKQILEDYFSNGKTLGKFVYYFVKKRNEKIVIYRDLERSPRVV